MIKNDLRLDHYYQFETRLILVRINAETMDNPVLKEW
jgi:hypothetical protein